MRLPCWQDGCDGEYEVTPPSRLLECRECGSILTPDEGTIACRDAEIECLRSRVEELEEAAGGALDWLCSPDDTQTGRWHAYHNLMVVLAGEDGEDE